jgi:hypothetical protein
VYNKQHQTDKGSIQKRKGLTSNKKQANQRKSNRDTVRSKGVYVPKKADADVEFLSAQPDYDIWQP